MTTNPDALAALLPCPFCGDPKPTYIGYMEREFVMCGNCGADVDSLNCEGDVRSAWNRRATLTHAPAPSTSGSADGAAVERDPVHSILERLALATDEGDSQARGTHYVDKQGVIRCTGSFLALIEDTRAAIAKATGATHD